MLQNPDIARGFMILLTIAIVIGGGITWMQRGGLQLLSQKVSTEINNEHGAVAGASDVRSSLDDEKAQLQEQLEQIKKDILEIRPETVAQQERVQKILKDLEGVKEQASESAKLLDWKGNLCEEAKKRFCQ